jgi:hypothetical protein
VRWAGQLSGTALAIPLAVMVITVIPSVMVVTVMIVAVIVGAAVIITVPPATRLGLVRDEYASEQKCYERANDDLHGATTSTVGTKQARKNGPGGVGGSAPPGKYLELHLGEKCSGLLLISEIALAG